jgi:glycosyltransferase involved in cell wall biosynthesis
LRQIGARNVSVLSQIGLSEIEIKTLAKYATERTASVKFVSVGRLLHWKGFHLGLHAFAQASLPNQAEYWVVGEGPELLRLQELTQILGITHRVRFCHRLSREETFKALGESLALIHPSLHDSGGLVCLESMAAGCPVVCLDLGGPGVQVTSHTGFKIPADTPEQVISDIADIMTQLANNQELQHCMGQAGQQRVKEQFSWQGKAQNFIRVYQDITTQ